MKRFNVSEHMLAVSSCSVVLVDENCVEQSERT